MAYLQDVPYLTKEIIREQDRRLLSERFDPPSSILANRADRPDPALRIYYSARSARLDGRRANIVSLEWAGKRPYMREMHLASRFPETFPWRDRLKERVKEIVLNRDQLVHRSSSIRRLSTTSGAGHSPYAALI